MRRIFVDLFQALGRFHEHTREDVDEYVRVLLDNVEHGECQMYDKGFGQIKKYRGYFHKYELQEGTSNKKYTNKVAMKTLEAILLRRKCGEMSLEDHFIFVT